MEVSDRFKSIASLIGEPARAAILWSLLDGKAFTATELAIRADISAQNASMHLKKMVEGDLLTIERQGRHRYYRFSTPEVAYVIESMANLLPSEKKKTIAHRDEPALTAITYCRTCYDHLAGKVGVAITDALLKQKLIVAEGSGYNVTARGQKAFAGLGIAVDELRGHKRAFARQCLDWSERRHHLAGALGAALLNYLLESGWVRKSKDSRAVIVTAKGQSGLYEMLNVTV
jgi:DNA-binding transcriptional ArsR family regulator